MSPHSLLTAQNQKDSPSDDLEATPEMCVHCFDVLIHKLTATSRSDIGMDRPAFVEQLTNSSIQCPLFITWQIRDQSSDPFELRGCIGTLAPRPLATSVGSYALTSAFSDRRFPPITLPEIPFLSVSVSLLVRYEICEHCHDWTVGAHGIMIQWRDEKNQTDYSATYLPEVAAEQQWDQKKTVKSLIRKLDTIDLWTMVCSRKITCTRYQSSKQKLTYDEYVEQKGGDPVKEVLKQLLEVPAGNKECSFM